MAKCLVTKLTEIVNDNSLLKVGELRFKVTKLDNPNKDNRLFSIATDKEVVISIIGDGYFTDSELSINKGTELTVFPNYKQDFYFSNGDYEISISDKYSLVEFQLYNNNVNFDISNIFAANKLINFNVYGTKSKGDIKVFKNMLNLMYIYVGETDVFGDLAVFENCHSLIDINLLGSLVEGDLAKLPESVGIVTGSSKYLDWTVSNRTVAFSKLLNILCNNMDKMLEDLAAMEVPVGNKVYSLFGVRTSASDDAIQKLQSNGFTVSINPT